jgi:hypothetical protein
MSQSSDEPEHIFLHSLAVQADCIVHKSTNISQTFSVTLSLAHSSQQTRTLAITYHCHRFWFTMFIILFPHIVIILGQRDSEDEGTAILKNVRIYSPNNTNRTTSQRPEILRSTWKMYRQSHPSK